MQKLPSKDAAAARLHEIAPDIALYEKEMKRDKQDRKPRRSSVEKPSANGSRSKTRTPSAETSVEHTTTRSDVIKEGLRIRTEPLALMSFMSEC